VPALQYDPARLAPLRATATRALRHLLDARSDDPAAASAVRVAAAVRADLEHGWLPAIDRLAASDAMTSWTTAGPPWAHGLAGRALGAAMAAEAEELLWAGSPARQAELVAVLRAHAADDEAMAVFCSTLGADALLDLVVSTAGGDDIALALQLRGALTHVAAAGDLPTGFGRQLVRAAQVQGERAGGMGDGGLALSFLFHGGDLPGALVVEALDEAILAERELAERLGGGPDIGAALWLAAGPNAARGLWADFDEPYRGDDLDAVDAQDPVYALLGQLARDANAGAGRAVFTDPARARYLLAERDVLADGGRAIVSAAANAAAGPDVIAGAPPALLEDASLVASAFVNLFGTAHAREVGPDDRVATATARLAGTHLYGVQHAMGADSTVTDRERIASLPADRRDAVVEGPPAGAVAELADRAFDGARPAAVFDPAALAEVVALAARTDAGVEALREVLSGYQQGVAAHVAGRLAAGDIAAADVAAFLAEVMGDSARLEGGLLARVGAEAERRGRDADGVVSFWIGAIGKGADAGSALFAPGASTVVGPGIDLAEHALQGALADAHDDAVADNDTRADIAGERLTYLWIRELHAAGLLDAELPAGVLVDGALPPYDDLVVALAAGGPTGWAVTTVIQQFDEAAGGAVDTDLAGMLDAMRATLARDHGPPG
jgi:hypothetical protein